MAGPPMPGRGGWRRRIRSVLRVALRTAVVVAVVVVVLTLVQILRANLSPDDGFNVLLITLDTQRVDQLSCYGSRETSTPAIDRLARSGVLFHDAVATIPRTTQNLCSVMTGRYPREHGVRRLTDTLDDGELTLAELLRAHGFRTAAFVNGGPLSPDQNLYQGFDHFSVYSYDEQSRALPTMLRALAWLYWNHPRKWFVWVHVYDPHFFYAPPWPFWSPGDPRSRDAEVLYGELQSGARRYGEVHFDNTLPEETRDYLRELYRGEVRYVDFAVGTLLRAARVLDGVDPGRRTLVVFTADHGESLGEHDYYYNHGNYLYEPDVRVPLVFSLPGVLPEGREVEAQVSSVDIFPTIAELLGSAEGASVTGRSLLELARGEPVESRAAFIESDENKFPENERYYIPGPAGRWLAVREDGHKLIRIPHPGGDRYELYDLRSDPAESRNLFGEQPVLAERLRTRLDEWLASMPADEGAVDEDEQDPETLERLRSLGYVD